MQLINQYYSRSSMQGKISRSNWTQYVAAMNKQRMQWLPYCSLKATLHKNTSCCCCRLNSWAAAAGLGRKPQAHACAALSHHRPAGPRLRLDLALNHRPAGAVSAPGPAEQNKRTWEQALRTLVCSSSNDMHNLPLRCTIARDTDRY